MGVHKLDHWDDLPRVEPMRRWNLRADQSKNPVKFDKVNRSLGRLQSHFESAPGPDEARRAIGQYRGRLTRALQLSTTNLRIAPGTGELHEKHAMAIRAAAERHERARRDEAVRETSGMTAEELDDIRSSIRREITEAKRLEIQETLAESDRRLAEAEEFVAELDEKRIVRSLLPEPTQVPTHLGFWWTYVDDSEF